MKRNGGTLTKYAVIELSEGNKVVVGKHLGDDTMWYEGETIRTSLLQNITDGVAETMNTFYTLGTEVTDPTEVSLLTMHHTQFFQRYRGV